MRAIALAALLLAACSSNQSTPIGRSEPGAVAISTATATAEPTATASAHAPPESPCIEVPEPRRMPDKRAAMVELLETEWVAVYVDPDAKGVKLPDYLKEAPYVVLDLGRDMPTPIKDLVFHDTGFDAELSFHREPFRVRVPYTAVFGFVSHTTQKGGLYADQIPEDARCGADAAATAEPAE